MRRVVGLALVLVGAFLLGSAAMSRFYLPDRLVVTPIDQFAQTDAVGPGTYLDLGSLTEKSSDLVARRTLRGDVKASSDDVAVWDVSVVLQTGTGEFNRASVDRVATDRRTAEAVACCGEAVDGEPVRHSGVSYKFPFNAEKRDYAWWDANTRRAAPAKFVSEERVKGLTVYKYIQTVPAFELRTQALPGSLLGETAPTVQAPVYFQTTRTAWVEPRTGIIIKANEQNLTTFRNSAGQDKVTFLRYDLTFDDATQGRQAKLANDSISQIRLLTLWLPLLGLVLGLLLIAAGIVILRADRPAAHRAARDEEPEPATS
ncbi:MAG TPA: DUF3068 domain-containing protein [Mycobacteriales bacterium]